MYRNSQGYEVLDENVDQKMIIIGGDMNCQIGEDGDADEDMITGIVHDRTSLEKKSSRRGKDLLCYMDDWGLTVLNGRTPGDIPSQFTYIDSRKKRTGEYFESGVLDLVFCSDATMPEVDTLEVLSDVHSSDHLPLN